MRHFGIGLALVLAFSISAGAKPWKLNSNLSCEARGAVIDRLAEQSQVRLSTQQAEIGTRFTVDWSRPGFPEREPIFLMVSFDAPVRLKGDGMYGLLPGAVAGFEIDWNQDQTRAVIPYYGRGMPKSGRIEVEPIVAGPLTVSWGEVGHTGCDQVTQSPNQGAQLVEITAAGRPKIVVRDPVLPEAPQVTYANPDGTRHLQVLEGRFRLLDAGSGSEIIEQVGAKPHFSPTGRYVVVPLGDTAGIYSSVDGTKLTPDANGLFINSDWSALIWSHQDSFVLQILGGGGLSQLHNLVATRTISTTDNGCRICGANQGRYLYDLENNVFLGEIYNQLRAVRLTTGAVVAEVEPDTNSGGSVPDRDRRTVLAGVTRQQAVTAVTSGQGLVASPYTAISKPFPTNYSSGGGLRANNEISNQLTKYLVPHQIVEAPNTPATDSRARLTQGFDKARFMKRMGEFGLGVSDGTPLTFIDLTLSASFDPAKDYGSEEAYQAARRSHIEALEIKHAEVTRSISAATGIRPGRLRPRDYPAACGVYSIENADEDSLLAAFHRAWTWRSGGATYWLTWFSCSEGSAVFLSPTTYLFSDRFESGAQAYTRDWGGVDYSLDLSNPDVDVATICPYALDACGFEAQVFGNLLILHSQDALGYAIIDLTTGQVIKKQFDLPRGDLFDDVLLTADGRHLVTVNEDGSFFVNRLADAQTVLSGLYQDDEIVVWTEDGRYDATPEGAYFVSYTFPGHIGEYTAQQFEGFLRVPGLAAEVLAGTYKPSPATITPPPVVQAEMRQEGALLHVASRLTSSAPLAEFAIFQDGLRTHRYAVSGTRTEATELIDLLPGTRWVSVVATDQNGVASAPASAEVTPTEKRRVHVLAVGVNAHDDPRIADLSFAVADATLFAETLRALPGIVIVSDTVLLDAEVTPERVLAELDRIIAEAKPGDTLALHYAGHGGRSPSDGRYYLSTPGATVSDLAGTAISMDRLSERLAASGLRIAMFLDACHSGEAGVDVFSTNDDIVESALNRIPSGLIVFAASKGREFSLEPIGGAANGFFTRAVADVLNPERGAHDGNANGAVELSELFRGTKSLVTRRADEAQAGEEMPFTQTPWMARNLMVGDFALF